MANGRRDIRLEKRWRGLIARQTKSGLGVRGFCRREGIAETSFYAWRRELQLRGRERLADSSPHGLPAFMPVRLAPERAVGMHDGVAIELGHGRVLRLPPEVSVARITELVRAVEAAS